MADLVQRLRDTAKHNRPIDPYKLLDEAADEIVTLQGKIEAAMPYLQPWQQEKLR